MVRPTAALLLAALTLVFGAGCTALRAPAPASAWAPRDGLVAWNRVDSLSGNGVEVFAGVNEALPLRAWAVRLDPARTRVAVAVSPDTHDVRETVSSFARRTGACVAVNGGYFRLGNFPASAVGLLVQNGRTVAAPTTHQVREGVRYRTARAALGFDAHGRPEIVWAGGDSLRLVAHAAPVPARMGAPADTLPPGRPWQPRAAMGAGPMLVRGGNVRVTAAEEVFFGTSIPATHPRTAAGVTADGALVFVVVDGRQAQSRGADLNELARLMQQAGARDALNLDGGGSSALVVRGVRLNRPTGGTVEREVMNALVATCTAGSGRGSE
jgi:uncharacterized protein YigE (DUF2233 family)